MSWSLSCVGFPKAVAAAVDKYSENLSGQSLAEFDEAKPHLLALINANFVSENSGGYIQPLLDFEASGSASVIQGKTTQSSCSVSIKPIWKTVV